jgi:hypothetical protein
VQVPPRLHKRVLSGFVDVPFVVEKAAEETAYASFESADELCERVEIALAGAG